MAGDDTPRRPETREDIAAILALKRAIIPGYVGDENALREEWGGETRGTEVHRRVLKPDPMYVRLAVEPDRQLVQAVEMLGPIATMKPILRDATAQAWTFWQGVAADWPIGGWVPDPLMASLIGAFDPVVRVRRPAGRVPVDAFDLPGLWWCSAPTFQAFYEATLLWA